MDTITRLQNNASAYKEMVERPMLAQGTQTLEDYFSLTDAVGGGKLKQRIRANIFASMHNKTSSKR